MNDELFKYLEFSLPVHNCVIIPDFGGFILNSEPTSLLVNGLVPPRFSVVFNPDLKHDDGILVNLYKKDGNLSYNVASQRLKESVKELKRELLAGKAVNCGRFGYLSADENNKTVFTANKFLIFPDSYGLKQVELRRLINIERVSEVSTSRFSLRHTLGGVAAAAIALFLFAVPSINIKDNSIQKYNQQAGFVSSLSTSLKPVLEQNVQNEDVEKPYVDKQVSLRTYYIIVGGEDSKFQADRLLEKVRNNGLKNASIVQSDRYRIYVASFTDKTEGESFLEVFRKENPQYSTAWLYSKRN
ncbi:MAG: SPOR domain-containing protein [Dysgonomonas sp.]